MALQYPVRDFELCKETNLLICSETKEILHNENGHAVLTERGNKAWIQNGKFHRADGPAVECIDFKGQEHCSIKFWYEGKWLPFEKWCIVANAPDELICMLKLKYDKVMLGQGVDFNEDGNIYVDDKKVEEELSK